MVIWGRPKTERDHGLYFRVRFEVLSAFKEFVNWLSHTKRKRICYEEALIELMKSHPKGLEILKKYKILKEKDVLW